MFFLYVLDNKNESTNNDDVGSTSYFCSNHDDHPSTTTTNTQTRIPCHGHNSNGNCIPCNGCPVFCVNGLSPAKSDQSHTRSSNTPGNRLFTVVVSAGCNRSLNCDDGDDVCFSDSSTARNTRPIDSESCSCKKCLFSLGFSGFMASSYCPQPRRKNLFFTMRMNQQTMMMLGAPVIFFAVIMLIIRQQQQQHKQEFIMMAMAGTSILISAWAAS
jgi:hypothetical protein